MKDGLEPLNNNTMVHRVSPTKIKVVPRDGELEIKLDITINVNTDGVISVASVEEAEASKKKEEDKVEYIVPDFVSGATLDFGKIVK